MGIAPVRQSDRLVELTAESCAQQYLALYRNFLERTSTAARDPSRTSQAETMSDCFSAWQSANARTCVIATCEQPDQDEINQVLLQS